LETSRLVCFSDKGFCRYYIGIKGSQKPCEWAYFSIETLKMLDECTGNSFDRRTVTRYAIRHNLLAPKYMRKVSWRLMIEGDA